MVLHSERYRDTKRINVVFVFSLLHLLCTVYPPAFLLCLSISHSATRSFDVINKRTSILKACELASVAILANKQTKTKSAR